MNLALIAVRRGPKRELQSIPPILAGKAPVMKGDNLRLDIDGNSVPGGLPISPEEVTWRFYYDGKLDLEFLGSQDEEKEGAHFNLGGIGLANLDRAMGCTVNVKLIAGTPGTTTAEVVAECRGASAKITLSYVD